jgi:uncharacterized protein
MAQIRPNRTLGPGHNDFWSFCAKGELRLQRCGGCGAFAWPVVAACERCGGDELAWHPVSGRGRVVSWCSFEHDYYRGVLPIPYDTILVELDEGPLFISNPEGFGREDTVFGMPVKLAFLDCEDAAGSFRLPVFEKA